MQPAIDLFNFVRRFGGATIAVCTFLACATALLFWLLVNRSAESGTQVSFMFGLVEHTKRVAPDEVLEVQQRHLINILAEHHVSFWPLEDCGRYEFVDAEGNKVLHVIYGDANNEMSLKGRNVIIIRDGDPLVPEPEPYYLLFSWPEIRSAFNQIQLTCMRHFEDEIPPAIQVGTEPVVVMDEVEIDPPVIMEPEMEEAPEGTQY